MLIKETLFSSRFFCTHWLFNVSGRYLRNWVLQPLLLLLVTCSVFAQPTFDEKLTTQCNVRLTVANVGLFGNNFKGSYTAKGYPSCEFPAGSGNENLGIGGIWVGAKVGSENRVSTSAFSSSSGYGPNNANFEFATETGTYIQERSSLRSQGSLFRNEAISHQDFLTDFTDKYIQAPGTIGYNPTPQHRPLGLQVHLESYNWNYSYSNFFVIFNYKIKNIGHDRLDSVFVGFWGETVLRNVLRNPAGSTGFYTQGGNGYLDTLNAGYEFDASPDSASVKSYVALKYLGATDKAGFRYYPVVTPNDTTKYFRVGYNTWTYNANTGDFQSPGTDDLRFGRLQRSMKLRPLWKSDSVAMKRGASRSTLLSAGPFSSLMPTDSAKGIQGDSITISFALVFGRQTPDGQSTTKDTPAQKYDIVKNLQWTQTVFDGNDRNHDGIADEIGGPVKRYILPAPPDIPITRVVARETSADIYWSKNAEATIDPVSLKKDFQGYRLYRTPFNFENGPVTGAEGNLKLYKSWDRSDDTLFYNTGFDSLKLLVPVNFPNDTVTYRYKYTLNNLEEGWQQALALTAFDNGDTVNNLPSLESAQLKNLFRVFPGKGANSDPAAHTPFAYPNPYYGGAGWEGTNPSSMNRRLMFADLPKRCVIRIFTAAGDLVDEIKHDQAWTGSDTKWYVTNSDPAANVMPGGEHAWDLLSGHGQLIARGMYLFTVQDLDTDKQYQGRFTLIK